MRRRLGWVVVALITSGVIITGWRFYLVNELKKPVLAKLSDPDSAQFQNLTYIGNWTVAGGVLCGQVNAKNKMGGYVGYQWFDAYSGGAMVEDDLVKKIYDDASLKRCDFSEDKTPFWHLRW